MLYARSLLTVVLSVVAGAGTAGAAGVREGGRELGWELKSLLGRDLLEQLGEHRFFGSWNSDLKASRLEWLDDLRETLAVGNNSASWHVSLHSAAK